MTVGVDLLSTLQFIFYSNTRLPWWVILSGRRGTLSYYLSCMQDTSLTPCRVSLAACYHILSDSASSRFPSFKLDDRIATLPTWAKQFRTQGSGENSFWPTILGFDARLHSCQRCQHSPASLQGRLVLFHLSVVRSRL